MGLPPFDYKRAVEGLLSGSPLQTAGMISNMFGSILGDNPVEGFKAVIDSLGPVSESLDMPGWMRLLEASQLGIGGGIFVWLASVGVCLCEGGGQSHWTCLAGIWLLEASQVGVRPSPALQGVHACRVRHMHRLAHCTYAQFKRTQHTKHTTTRHLPWQVHAQPLDPHAAAADAVYPA